MLAAKDVKSHLHIADFFRSELGELRPGSNGNALALCPFHRDTNPSLSVNLATGAFNCFGCGASGDVIDFAMKKWQLPFRETLLELARFAGLDPDAEDRRGEEGLTLEVFAQAKQLPIEFLREHGVKGDRGKDGRPYIVFEYRGIDGQVVKEATRIRFSMAERPKAKKNGKPALYGLWRKQELLAEEGELLLVEGESDALTAWFYGLPAVGVPGKTLLKTLDPQFFQDFRSLYVWEEPDAQGWAREVANRLKDLPHIRILAMTPPDGMKDLSEAHLQGLDVVATIRQMKRQATPVSSEPPGGAHGAREITYTHTLNYLTNICKEHASEGGDPSLCREVIDFLTKRGKRFIAEEVREWVLTTIGNFLTTDVYKDLHLTTRDHKKAAVMALLRLEAEGLIEKCGKRRGLYRRVERDCEPIDFLNAPDGPPLPLRWPLSLETLVKLYPKNVAVVAGSKDAGKTAFCLNFAWMNQDKFEVYYFCSEIAVQEFRERLKLFGEPLSTWKIKAFERSSNFADVIKPDAINIIDFLEITDKFYLIAEELRRIHDKLRNGMALVAIQKDHKAQLGRGSSFGLEKARLYVTLDNEKQRNVLTIVSGKNWASDRNPRGVKIGFKIIKGGKIIDQ